MEVILNQNENLNQNEQTEQTKKVGRPQALDRETFLNAIMKHKTLSPSILAEKLGVGRTTIYRFIEANPQVYEEAKAFLEGYGEKPKELTFEAFQNLTEIQHFLEFQKAKGRKEDGISTMLKDLYDFMLITKKYPRDWDETDIQKILAKLNEQGISLYGKKQSLRRFFETTPEKAYLLKHPLLACRREDLKSPRKKEVRTHDFMTPEIFMEYLKACDYEHERLLLKVHVTLKCREGSKEKDSSLLGLKWENVNWNDDFYGFQTVTIDVYESKTRGGIWWRHIPLNLFFKELPEEFKRFWEIQGKPKEGYVWIFNGKKFTYPDYLQLFRKLNKKTGYKFRPHDLRRTGGSQLHQLGLDNLAIGETRSIDEAIGYGGVGWENSEIFYKTYGRLNPITVYSLDTTYEKYLDFFTGLVRRFILAKLGKLNGGN